jgi:hypothetical protein
VIISLSFFSPFFSLFVLISLSLPLSLGYSFSGHSFSICGFILSRYI